MTIAWVRRLEHSVDASAVAAETSADQPFAITTGPEAVIGSAGFASLVVAGSCRISRFIAAPCAPLVLHPARQS